MLHVSILKVSIVPFNVYNCSYLWKSVFKMSKQFQSTVIVSRFKFTYSLNVNYLFAERHNKIASLSKGLFADYVDVSNHIK
jgi:hypothetical protein